MVTEQRQGDTLRLGMNWTEDDLRKQQVLVDSAYGMAHPSTFHFHGLVQEVSNGAFGAGGKPAEFAVSDICEGVVQATEGLSCSLVSPDVMGDNVVTTAHAAYYSEEAIDAVRRFRRRRGGAGPHRTASAVASQKWRAGRGPLVAITRREGVTGA
jgi:dihydroxyacid dehydratase/phosphogluconate dehydratase